MHTKRNGSKSKSRFSKEYQRNTDQTAKKKNDDLCRHKQVVVLGKVITFVNDVAGEVKDDGRFRGWWLKEWNCLVRVKW